MHSIQVKRSLFSATTFSSRRNARFQSRPNRPQAAWMRRSLALLTPTIRALSPLRATVTPTPSCESKYHRRRLSFETPSRVSTCFGRQGQRSNLEHARGNVARNATANELRARQWKRLQRYVILGIFAPSLFIPSATWYAGA